ncbi:MAG: hypothetical protein U0798_13535 [Gemmataceae bacterium]
MTAPTRITVTIDTEEEWDWASGYPTGRTSVSNIAQLAEFQNILDSHGAKATYFTNHAVLTNGDSCEQILKLAERPNVEIGVHIHPWNTPPLQKGEMVPPRESFLHNLPWDLARQKLGETFAVFERAGLAPTSFRGGRYSTSNAIQNELRDHGIVADCSVLPFNTWADDGAPDYRHRNLDPVRLPPRHAGDKAMWELPLSFGFIGRPFSLWKWAFRLFDSKPFKSLPFGGLVGRLFGARKCWLNFENPLGEEMTDLFDVLRRFELPYACFTLHSSSLLPGGSPYCRTAADRDRLLKTLDETLATVAKRSDFVPSTITETVQHLEALQHAGHRHQPVG